MTMRLPDLQRMAIFAVVVREGSISSAARVLGLSKAAVSDHLSKLEATLDAKLLHRTTRRMSLTEAGESFHRSCAHILEEAETATAVVRDLQAEPKGLLRVTAPPDLGPRFLVPRLTELSRRYPKLDVELLLDDRVLDLLKEQIDVAIRGGWPEESSLVSRRLADMNQVLCASPEYLARAGCPTEVAALKGHRWCTLSSLRSRNFTFSCPDGTQKTVTASSNTVTSSVAGLHAFILCGAGVGVLPEIVATDDLTSGRLVRLLEDHELPRGGIYALFPSRYLMTPKVQRFLDLLEEPMPADLLDLARQGRRAGSRGRHRAEHGRAERS